MNLFKSFQSEKMGAPTTAHPLAKTSIHHEQGHYGIIAQKPEKINLGNIYTTPAVSDEMGRNNWFRYDIHAAMGRFTAGDWGECFESDAEFNNNVLEAGDDKIIGVYDTQAGRIWMMAEPWRETTTILFENEY